MLPATTPLPVHGSVVDVLDVVVDELLDVVVEELVEVVCPFVDGVPAKVVEVTPVVVVVEPLVAGGTEVVVNTELPPQAAASISKATDRLLIRVESAGGLPPLRLSNALYG